MSPDHSDVRASRPLTVLPAQFSEQPLGTGGLLRRNRERVAVRPPPNKAGVNALGDEDSVDTVAVLGMDTNPHTFHLSSVLLGCAGAWSFSVTDQSAGLVQPSEPPGDTGRELC